jgi:hypothetical protein
MIKYIKKLNKKEKHFFSVNDYGRKVYSKSDDGGDLFLEFSKCEKLQTNDYLITPFYKIT